MTPEQYLLASAYLDGELTDEERRLAEADPAVMAEVEELRALHVDLADVEPPTVDARESAIAAAMAAFAPVAAAPAAAPASTAPAANAPVVPFKPRPSYSRYLGVAAAVVAVGLLGTVIATNRGGDDEASTAATEAPSADRITESADAPEATDSAAILADESSAEMSGDDAADAPAEEALPAPASEPTDEPSDEPASDSEGDMDMMPSNAALPADDVLRVYAEDLIARRDARELGPTPNTDCVVPDAPNAFILELAELPTEVGSVELFMAIDDTTRMVYGLDPETCDLLVDAPLP